jgi:biotin transport system substrate-specific component
MSETRTRSLVLCGLSIALLAVGAFITVPFGPVPFTLQSMMLALIVLILRPREALIAVGGYLLLGAIGLPIGAGFKGGLGWLLGPTGGFLLGFFMGTALAVALRVALSGRGLRDAGAHGERGARAQSALRARWQTFALDSAQILIIFLVSYACGTFWFAVSTNASIPAALIACVAPFVVPDLLKAAAALTCAYPVRAALGRSVRSPRPDSLA